MIHIIVSRCKDLTELAVYDCKSLTNNVVDHILVGQNLTILTLPDKIKAAGLKKVHFTNI